MLKMRTHRGAAKRAERTASDQLKRPGAFISHLFANKGTKQKRQLRRARLAFKNDMKCVKQLLTYEE